MFWIWLAALYLLGAPVSMFIFAAAGILDTKDIDVAETSDVIFYVLLWPLSFMLMLVVGAAALGEWLRKGGPR